jgi:hypothetical protein
MAGLLCGGGRLMASFGMPEFYCSRIPATTREIPRGESGMKHLGSENTSDE